MASPENDGLGGTRSLGGSTHWSVLLGTGSLQQRAWQHFYERYRPAVGALFARQGVRREDEDDLVHEFFTAAFERGLLGAADPARGRFRGYLRTAALRFLVSARRHQGRAKRRPAHGVGSLPGEELLQDPGQETAEQAFDRAWARSLLAAALERTRDALAERGRLGDFEAFHMRTHEGSSWEEIAARLATNPEAARKRVGRVQERVTTCLRQEVADTVSSPADLEAELAELAAIVAEL